jgi:hypothetical protein
MSAKEIVQKFYKSDAQLIEIIKDFLHPEVSGME